MSTPSEKKFFDAINVYIVRTKTAETDPPTLATIKQGDEGPGAEIRRQKGEYSPPNEYAYIQYDAIGFQLLTASTLPSMTLACESAKKDTFCAFLSLSWPRQSYGTKNVEFAPKSTVKM